MASQIRHFPETKPMERRLRLLPPTSKKDDQEMLFVSPSKIVGQTTPAAKLTPRTPTLRVPPGRPNFERLGGKAAKTHERVDITSLPLRDRKRRILAQLKRALDLAAESNSRTG
jgi:hypothetical protein